jgi:pheromone a factor receptor
MDPTFPLVPIVNFFFAFLLTLLLPWRLSSWSTALRVYTVWLIVLCTCRGINSIIWRDNVENVAPIWCDISEQIFR